MEYVLKNERGVRAFLNDVGEEDAGHIQGSLNCYNASGSYEATLTVGDCSRTVALNFDFKDKEEQTAAVRKMQRLIDAAQHMQELIRNAAIGN